MKFSFPRFVLQFPSSVFGDGFDLLPDAKDGDPDEVRVGRKSLSARRGARRERRVGREIPSPSPSRIVSCRVVGLKGENEEEDRKLKKRATW